MKKTNEEKKCTKCQESKPVAEFNNHKTRRDGKQSYCRDCKSAIQREYRNSIDGRCHRATDNARQNAKKYGAESTLTLAEVKAILSVERCAYCHAETPQKKRTLDHVQPLNHNGANTFENVVMACHTCNTAKNSKPVYDFIMKQSNSDATRLLLATLSERMDVAPIQALRLLERQQTAFTEKRFRAKHYGESAQ